MTKEKLPPWLTLLWIAALVGIICYIIYNLNRPPVL